MAEKVTVQSGIYVIINAVNGKIYTGSTIDFKDRWRAHRSELRRGAHGNPHLQHAWNKYGEGAFEFLICEYVEDKEQLHAREQYWLDWHRTLTEVYNYGLVARSPNLGRRASEETRHKLSESHKGNNHRLGCKHTTGTRHKIGEALAGSYPAFINQYTGEIIPAGVNLHALDRERGLDQRNMNAVKTGKCRSHKGWILQSEHFQPWLL